MQFLDLRYNGKLEPDISLLFNQISQERREGFNDAVAAISEPHIDSIDWWVEGPASRNTASSPLFHRYCCLFLILRLIDTGKFSFSRVVVDSKEFGNILKQIFKDKAVRQTEVYLENYIQCFAKRIARQIFLIPVLSCKILIRVLIARLTKHLTIHKMPSRPLVLIDTFILPAYTDSDRWYGSLWENLSEEQKETIFFVPTVVMTPIKSFFRVFKQLRINKKNFLLKEDFLTISDIVYASLIKRRLKKITVYPILVEGYEISGIIRNELLNNSDILTVLESLLTYRFIKRLKEQAVKVRASIDWFEGFAIDKAWNLGFNRFFPEVRRIGFRAFESYPFYLSSFPIPVEKLAGVIPTVFAVQGKGTIETIKEFMEDAEVIVMPSFRSQHVWDNILSINKVNKSQLDFIILVTLPIGEHMTAKILQKLSDACESINSCGKKLQFIIKFHPAFLFTENVNNLISNLPPYFSVTDEKSFPSLIKRADLLVSEASSTCLEALACGVPVIVVQNDEGLAHNPFPAKIPSHLYSNIRTADELSKALNCYIKMTDNEVEKQISDAKWVRENYFEPISVEGVHNLLYA